MTNLILYPTSADTSFEKPDSKRGITEVYSLSYFEVIFALSQKWETIQVELLSI